MRTTEGAPAAWAPLNAALRAYRQGQHDAVIVVHNDAEPAKWFPVSLFFRPESELDDLHAAALRECRGRVLDVGAAAGAASLILQGRGLEVTALDPVPEAVAIMRERGVADARCGDVFTFQAAEPYDTALLLMNGSMIAGTLSGLARMLTRLAGLLRPGGRVIMDSTDPRDDQGPVADDGRYAGELHFQLEFQDRRGPLFPQLFVDPHTLAAHATDAGFETAIIQEGEEGAFLAVLTLEAC